ncbi:sensor histidine kinase [Clostridium estertheticum]|uniref:Sensor histidine kinase n=1 Tax=Clostridium estertheticum TaxID=238834 RepID=A0A5N7IZQ6_9CLOT|nr:histidine kinase [Clostridium estertheticum]MPQ31269.1 sensor histidine kinase [Clostridium estertheticum]MPQ61943.1 sensor histidine kinase [Clostridium estertheticum]
MGKRNRNFKESIRYFFLKYTVISLILVYPLFFAFMVIILKINTINNTKQATNDISASLEHVYRNYYDEINKMSNSNTVINLINNRLHSNTIYDEFYKFNINQKVKSVFYIVDNDGIFLISTTTADDEISKPIVENITLRAAEKPNEVIKQTDIVNYSNNKETVYTFAKSVKDGNGKIVGCLIYQLYEEDLQQLIRVRGNEIAVVTDEYSNIIVTNNNSVKGLMNKFIPKYYYKDKYVNLDVDKYYINKKALSTVPIYVYTLNTIEIKNMIFVFYFLFLIIVSIGFWFLINYFANRMSSRNTKSIDTLILSVNELQNGRMNSYVDIKSGDEFEILGNQYNIMLDELNALIKKNEELFSLRRIVEIKQLQSQFNPHFIFNVLETLRYSILIAPKEAEEIVIGLSKLLRYSVNYKGQKVMLRKDLEYIEDYLKLNKHRFNDKLKYNIDIYEGVKDAYVPKLLLQPIIENSIKYGYLDKDIIEINVAGELNDGIITLEVKDTGTGIRKEQLDNIRRSLKESENITEHTGLYNIHRRLVLLYGGKYGIEIESIFGEGTNVKLTIPYEKSDI